MQPYTPDEFAGIAFDRDKIQRRVCELGAQISADYRQLEDRDHLGILAVGLMRGAMPFMADLGRAMDLALVYDLMWLSSYADSNRPGKIELEKDLNTSVTGRHVLLMEDIVDTGHTLKFAHDLLKSRNPASVRTCCLLDKRPRREIEVPVEYVGFVLDGDEFVVGYGLDYAGRYRNLPYIALLHPRIYQNGANGSNE